MTSELRFLRVREGGVETTVELCGGEFPEEDLLPELEDEIQQIRERECCKVLAFDLKGLVLMTSSVLAFLVVLARDGLQVRLLNSSQEIQQYLEVTKLDQLIQLG